MKKVLNWVWENILFLETLFLLIFIPLFPKIPVLDVKNTWVYIRAEDFVVFFVLLSWLALLVKKRINLKTPLTLPIFAFWIIGAIATIHGILLVFPTLANVFPNVAFLSLVRHIEYMSLFFIAYQGMKDKRLLPIIITVLIATLIGVIGYGFGQKYLGFPAYLTSNEEFAKGIPIQLSQLSRVPSTFAGHYDLAAYLVLIIPILVSLFFGVRNWLIKVFLLLVSFLGFILLFMTVSRVSFLVLFASLLIVFFFQKRKLILFSIPVVVVLAISLIILQPTLLDRFKSTVSTVDVVVDAKTGESVGHVTFVPAEYFRDKIVLQRRVKDNEELTKAITGSIDGLPVATSGAILPFELIPDEVPLVKATNVSTGESLPQGTGYINLSLSPVIKRLGNFYYELPPDVKSSPSAQALVLHGDFIVKRAEAYDLSFTTRFQGEWPRAIEAFQRNILVGSGYGSVSLAVDNNYFRILGEIGLLGFISFFIIFLSIGIYIRKIYPDIDSPLAKSFVLGFGAGVVGLALNAVLIDVFEASKIAFLLWILSGITIGLLVLYKKRDLNLITELKSALTSSYAIVIYLLFLSVLMFSSMIDNFFVGDDFTWFRWAADCLSNCSPLSVISNYFVSSDGFFYRPGTKLYFYLMYQNFWLNQVVYHAFSLFLHFGVSALFFLLSLKILRNKILAVFAAVSFLIMSGSSESVFWIASTGHLFNALFGLLGLLFFIQWDEKKKIYYYILSFIAFSLSLLFHELGVVFPLLVLAYRMRGGNIKSILLNIKKLDFLALFIPVLVYLVMRFLAQSHWQGGDYSYDLLMLPFNIAGNVFGYISLSLVGPMSLSIYSSVRALTRENLLLVSLLAPVIVAGVYLLYKFLKQKLSGDEKQIVIFSGLFFFISLLPFIGLGNITSRYSYLASLGVILIFALLVKKLYEYLQSNGRDIALSAVSIFVIVFSLFHIIQLQQSYFDWAGAGEKSRKFFVSIDSFYSDLWSNKAVEFHFVDVPIKVGEAWVFPVGLEDAVWFAFQNKDAKVFIHSTTEEALDSAGYSIFNKVLKFTPDGTVEEVKRPETQIIDNASGIN